MRHGQDTVWRAPLTGARFYPGCTQRIPQRSRLRRGFVPASPVTCRRESNDSPRLDRRGELLLRVVRVGRVCGVRVGVWCVGADRDRAPSDHPGFDLGGNGHSTDGSASRAQQGRRVSRLPAARVEIHSVAAEVARKRNRTRSGSTSRSGWSMKMMRCPACRSEWGARVSSWKWLASSGSSQTVPIAGARSSGRSERSRRAIGTIASAASKVGPSGLSEVNRHARPSRLSRLIWYPAPWASFYDQSDVTAC